MLRRLRAWNISHNFAITKAFWALVFVGFIIWLAR